MEKTAAESGRMVSRLSDFGEDSAITSLRDLNIPPTDISASGIEGFFESATGSETGSLPQEQVAHDGGSALEEAFDAGRHDHGEFKLLREGKLTGGDVGVRFAGSGAECEREGRRLKDLRERIQL